MKKSVLDFTRSTPIENPVVINDITWISILRLRLFDITAFITMWAKLFLYEFAK
ncbi:MAG TPA: hypothetical protein VFY55_04785 [Nitrososphaeraceae archaeon]|nr:hypothetical protein [Nitrososphaeraceae archaeon]